MNKSENIEIIDSQRINPLVKNDQISAKEPLPCLPLKHIDVQRAVQIAAEVQTELDFRMQIKLDCRYNLSKTKVNSSIQHKLHHIVLSLASNLSQ